MPHQSGAPFVGESRGLWASVTLSPHPHPALSTFLLLPHFSRGPIFVRVVPERLLRRLGICYILVIKAVQTTQQETSFDKETSKI